MPGFIIHLATANEYIRKYPKDIKNKNDFLEGSIAPDLTTKEGKKETHYGQSSAEVELRKYLMSNSVESDYDKGYFLHLVTDYLFYNKLLEVTSKDIYNDYDILNSILIEKYNVKTLEKIKDKVFFKDGDTKILSKELAEKTIELSSDNLLEKIKKEILDTEYTEKWDKIRKLKRLD